MTKKIIRLGLTSILSTLISVGPFPARPSRAAAPVLLAVPVAAYVLYASLTAITVSGVYYYANVKKPRLHRLGDAFYASYTPQGAPLRPLAAFRATSEGERALKMELQRIQSSYRTLAAELEPAGPTGSVREEKIRIFFQQVRALCGSSPVDCGTLPDSLPALAHEASLAAEMFQEGDEEELLPGDDLGTASKAIADFMLTDQFHKEKCDPFQVLSTYENKYGYTMVPPTEFHTGIPEDFRFYDRSGKFVCSIKVQFAGMEKGSLHNLNPMLTMFVVRPPRGPGHEPSPRRFNGKNCNELLEKDFCRGQH